MAAFKPRIKTSTEQCLQLAMEFCQSADRANDVPDYRQALVQTDISLALSKALKKKGFKFVGPTTCYAFMQAVGMVDDHENNCTFKST